MESHFGSYISCIKIANQPIIPPLLDDQRREEMRYYRQLAIMLETHKKQERSSIDSEATISSVECSASKKDLQTEPTPIEPQTPTNDALFADTEELVCVTRKRSNSYTLETPSPVLLAFIKSLQNDQSLNSDSKLHEIFMDKKDSFDLEQQPSTPSNIIEQLTIEDLETDEQLQTKSSKRKLWDIDQAKNAEHLQPMSLPNSNFVSPIMIKRSYQSDVCVSYRGNYSEDYEYIENIESLSINDEPISKNQARKSSHSTPNKSHPENDSFGKDFCLLDVSLNVSREIDGRRESTFSDCSSVSLNKFIPSFDKKPSESHEAEYEAFLYFKEQLKIKHRKQLALLLQEQQREHDLLKEQFQKISRPSSYCKSSPSTPVRPFSRDTFTKKPSPNKHKSSVVLDDSVPIQIPIPSDEIKQGKIQKAASKINAAVRGYLTRRLFKTSRVLMLVQTIKDCLVTAVSLQNEMNLGLSELDLQNRLLQQLTTACNELNEIFSLPVKDRMAVIADDREKKKREFRRTHTPLPLSEATRRSLQRKLTSSAPSGERKQYRKRCKSASSVHSDSSNSQPSQRRPLSSSSFSHKYSVAQPNRKPWR